MKKSAAFHEPITVPEQAAGVEAEIIRLRPIATSPTISSLGGRDATVNLPRIAPPDATDAFRGAALNEDEFAPVDDVARDTQPPATHSNDVDSVLCDYLAFPIVDPASIRPSRLEGDVLAHLRTLSPESGDALELRVQEILLDSLRNIENLRDVINSVVEG